MSRNEVLISNVNPQLTNPIKHWAVLIWKIYFARQIWCVICKPLLQPETVLAAALLENRQKSTDMTRTIFTTWIINSDTADRPHSTAWHSKALLCYRVVADPTNKLSHTHTIWKPNKQWNRKCWWVGTKLQGATKAWKVCVHCCCR